MDIFHYFAFVLFFTLSSLRSLTCAQCSMRLNPLAAMRCVLLPRPTTASASTSAATVKPRSGPRWWCPHLERHIEVSLTTIFFIPQPALWPTVFSVILILNDKGFSYIPYLYLLHFFSLCNGVNLNCAKWRQERPGGWDAFHVPGTFIVIALQSRCIVP